MAKKIKGTADSQTPTLCVQSLAKQEHGYTFLYKPTFSFLLFLFLILFLYNRTTVDWGCGSVIKCFMYKALGTVSNIPKQTGM